jgi:hypothetical protein
MCNKLITTIILISCFFLSSYSQIILPPPGEIPVPRYPCPTNGNAESGNFTNWTTYTGTAAAQLNPASFTNNFNSDRFGVHSNVGGYTSPTKNIPMINNGVDRYGNFSLPSEGNFCFRMGNDAVGSQAEIMKYTFTVTNSNKNFKMRYALVLEDGGHTGGTNPGAAIYMLKGNKIIPDVSDLGIFNATLKSFEADLDDPYWKRSATPNVVYRAWECVEYDLSAYVGQQVSFVAYVKDCVQGAHFGYMYLDGLCNGWPAIANLSLNDTEYCLNDEIIMNGSASTGEDRYFVEVAEVEEYGSYTPNGLVINKWHIASEAPNNFNISQFVEANGGKLECGKIYEIKLAVQNNCAPWNSKSKRIRIKCPNLNLGPDIVRCCSSSSSTPPVLTTLGPNPIAGNTYQWSSIPAGMNSTFSKITVAPSTNIAYILTMTEPDGCYNRDTILFRFENSSAYLDLSTSFDLCDSDPIITANIGGFTCQPSLLFTNQFGEIDYGLINWYLINPSSPNNPVFLGTGKSVKAPNQDGKVRAVYNPVCGAQIIKEIDIFYRPNGRDLIFANTVFPNSTIWKNQQLYIWEFGPIAPLNNGEGPAYDISDFRLKIWNRWGVNFRTITKATVGRQPDENVMQGDIRWDARDQYGDLVPTGTYAWTLEMKYCGSDVFVPVQIPGGEWEICLARNFLSVCTKRLSGHWGKHVNVVR